MRQRIRLTESQLNRVIKESVKRVLREYDSNTPRYEVYDSNNEVADSFDTWDEANEYYQLEEMQFIFDTKTNKVIEGTPAE